MQLYFFFMLLTMSVIFLHEMSPIQWTFSQHCGHWWPGAWAPGHQYPQYWVHTHVFPAVYGLTQWYLQQRELECHDDIMPWEISLHYWPFVRGIHWSLVDSLSIISPLWGESTGHWWIPSVLLAFCEGNLPITGGFPWWKTGNPDLWCFICYEPEQVVE